MRAEMDCPSSGYWTMGTLHVCGVRREEVTAWTSGDVRGRGYLGRVRLSGVGQAPGDKSLLPGSSPRWKGPWEIKGRVWPLCKTLAELTLTETTRPTKPKIFPYPARYRKVCCSLLYSNYYGKLH